MAGFFLVFFQFVQDYFLMNQKLAILCLLATVAVTSYACEGGSHDNLECTADSYVIECLNESHYMVCEIDKLVVKECDTNTYCKTNDDGSVGCISNTAAECSELKPCSDPNKVCNTEGNCVEKQQEPECTIENANEKCPAEKPVCKDGVCTAKAPECTEENANEKCPAGKPVCKDGVCSEKEPECTEENANETCPVARPVCKDGICVAKEPECTEENANEVCPIARPVCKDGICIAKEILCTEENADEVCPVARPVCKDGKCTEKEPECTVENAKDNCPAIRPVCKNGVCTEREPECTEENAMKKCPANKPICQNGICTKEETDPKCLSNATCPSNAPICQNGICTPLENVKCAGNSTCGAGYVCDYEKCIPENSCTKTHPCPDKQVCHNGTCIKNTIKTCNSTTPCADKSKTCVAGKCIACNCAEDETCTLEGTCVKTKESKIKSLKVGDKCDYEPNFTFCEDNRLFTCTQSYGEEFHKLGVRDCGAKICADSTSEGRNCHEPCDDTSDFFGECLALYNGESGYDDYYAFLSICEEDSKGNKFWTFEDKNPACSGTCTNGACDYIHPEYGKACFEATYPDKCDGDWYLFCASNNPQFSGIISGENCPKVYSPDAYCAEDADGVPQCVTKCDKENNKSNRCMSAYGAAYSDSIVCLRGKDGKLAWFMTEYDECANGCDEKTGKCK